MPDEILFPIRDKYAANGMIANGAAEIVSPSTNKRLNNRPPDASPNLFMNVSMKTVDLYFSVFSRVVYTVSLAGLLTAYSYGLTKAVIIRNTKAPEPIKKS